MRQQGVLDRRRLAAVVLAGGRPLPLARPGLDLQRWVKPLIVGLAVGGAIFGIGTVLKAFAIGMWPPHDTSAFWLAGRHVIEGTPVYGGGASWYLAFVYAPPLAILMALPGLLHYQLISIGLLVLQVLALRYVTGSWLVTAMLGWVPWVHHEFVAGNVDCLMAASIYAALRNERGAGAAVALFTFAKFSPVLVLARAPRRQWIEFAVTVAVLLLITLPALGLWPEWFTKLAARDHQYTGIMPLIYRVPVVAVLLFHRQRWSVAAAAALATPVFYTHSIVLVLPAIRLWWDDGGREMLARRRLSLRLS